MAEITLPVENILRGIGIELPASCMIACRKYFKPYRAIPARTDHSLAADCCSSDSPERLFLSVPHRNKVFLQRNLGIL
jgi:hypothetical protein